MATRKIKKIAIKDKLGNLNQLDLSLFAQNVDATLEVKGITMLQTVVDDTETKAATPKAVNSVKQIADANTTEIAALKELVGDAETPGTVFTNVAFTNKENTFANAQKITVSDKTLSLNTQEIYSEGTTGDTLKVGIKDADGAKSEITFGNDGTIKRTAIPTVPEVEPDDNEVATVKYVKDKADEINANIEDYLKDATDVQKGVVVLSDSTDSDLDASTGHTAATPKAVKDVKTIADTNTSEITTIKERLDAIDNEIEASNKGQKTLAYKDYTQAGEQTDMEIGVYYMVPFNAQDQFIKFDPSTGRPSATQADGVTDTKVKYCVVMYKGTEGAANNLGMQDQEMDFDLFATLAGNNTFTGNNTFNNAPTKIAQSTDTKTLTDLADGTLISKKEFVEYTANSFDQHIQVVESEPALESAEEGTIYFIVEAEN